MLERQAADLVAALADGQIGLGKGAEDPEQCVNPSQANALSLFAGRAL